MELTHGEYRYYSTIHNFAKKFGRFPSRQELADLRGVNKNAAQKMVKGIVKKGWAKDFRGVYETKHAKLEFLPLSQS